MKKKSVAFFALLFSLAMSQIVQAAPERIEEVNIERSGFFYNRQTDTFDTTVTIRNTSSVPLAAPLQLVLESVLPKSLSLYNLYGKTGEGKPYVTVPLSAPDFSLPPGKTASVPVRFVNLGQQVAVTDFSVRAERLDPAKTALLNINAVVYPEGGGGPVGAGYAVLLNGTIRALTDDDGHASIVAPLDTTEIMIKNPPYEKGLKLISGLTAGETRNIEIEVDDGGGFGAFSVLRIDRLQHLMLPANVPQVVLRFFENEKAVVGDFISLVELRDPAGGWVIDVTHLFSLRSDGSLVAKSADFFKAMGNPAGKKLLYSEIINKNGVPFSQEIPFYVSSHKIQASLSAPPSNPNLPLGGITIEVSVLNTDIKFEAESLPDGSFTLPFVPSGNLTILASRKYEGVSYVGQGTAVITGNTRIDLKMRAPEDALNNVPPITTSPL